MTQTPQDEFETSLEKAEAWMKEVQERVKENDNTQGPRSALECRLRETEKICALEPDGKVLLDLVLTKAENILGESSDDEKHEIHVKLGKIKAMFEETTIYMTHCHSRIEWVWLHWNEYLRTRDEFLAWVHDMILMLEPDMELQLGRKEKCWQFEQSQVLLRDVNNHSKLLDRLLEEASSLYNRIGDPSVDDSVQSAMINEYKQIKKKTQERAKCLEKIWRDHEAYEKEVNLFKSWLNSVIEKLKCCVGSASESTEIRLNMLQEIGKDVEIGNKQLEHLEEKAADVIKDTSPKGAEKICQELEELKRTLAELKAMNDEEEEGLLKTYNSDNAFAHLAVQLEGNINEFRKAVQRLEESLESGEKVKTEEELIALWKTLNATKSSLAALEAIAERVKVQLKDLFKFSKDIQPLSDSVIAAMREYQRAKSKAFKLSTDTESELRQLFQNPLREFLYWKPIAESVLDSTAVAANNGAANPDALDRVEKLLEESSAIKEKLAELDAKKDGIHSVLGDDRTKLLLRDVSAAEAERAALYRDLLERRSQLQNLAIQSEEFDSALRRLQKKVSSLRTKCAKENEMQPDIIGKEAQLQRLQTLLDQLTKLQTPIKELNAKMETSPNHSHRASKLLSDYLTLERSLENNIRKTKEFINWHWMFNNELLDLQRWMMETRHNLEAFLDGGNDWGEREVEALLFEVSEKDIQRHRVEAQGQLVIETSSPEGAALIHTELRQLLESWESLQHLCEKLSRSLKERTNHTRKPTAGIEERTSLFLPDEESHSPPQNPAERTNPGSSKRDSLRIGIQNDDSHNGGAEGHHGGFSGADMDGYTRGSSSMADYDDTSLTSDTTQTGQTGNPDSNGNEPSRGNISGKANANISVTEVESPQKGGSSGDSNKSSRGNISGKANSSISVAEVESAHKGDSSSGGNESSRGNVSGKANFSISITEVESAQQGGSSSNGNESNRGNISGKGNSSISITEVESGHTGGSGGDGKEFSRGNVSRKANFGISITDVDSPHQGGSSSDGNDSNSGNVSRKANSSISIIEVESGQQGGSSSNESNISGKANYSIAITDVELAHQGGSRGVTSPAQGSGSSDKSIKITTEMNKTNGKSRIPRPAGTFGSPGKSVKRSTEINITNGEASANDGGREELNDKTSFKMSPNKTKINSSADMDGYSSGSSSMVDNDDTSITSNTTQTGQTGNPDRNFLSGRIITENSWNEGERNSPATRGTSRRNRKVVSLAESVDVVDSPPTQSIGENKITQPQMGTDHTKLLLEFEQWLKVENIKLNRVCAEKSSGRGGGNTWRSTLQALKSRVPQGQKIFEGLLLRRPAMSVTEDLRLEDLRYRWMLYKSKLRDSGIHASQNLTHEPRDVTKKSGGICSFLHRVCCAALPLQLLLLLLLLLAFLLPLLTESQNCALANNFARSFNLMLKYDGPPPT